MLSLILGLIVGLAGILLSIYFYIKPRSVKKKISYSIRSIGLLPSPPRLADLQITYRGEEIKSLYMTRIVLWNAGDDVVKGKEDIYPEDKLRIVFEKPSLNIEAKILYASNGVNEKISLSEGILIDFDFLDPRQGLVIQIMHQNPSKAFKIEGRMINSHRNKISESQLDGVEDNLLTSFIYTFRIPIAICLWFIPYSILSHILIILLGYIAVALNFLSAEHFDFIRDGGGSALNPERESFLVIASVAASFILTMMMFSKLRNVFDKKYRDIVRISCNIEAELMAAFQSSTWSATGRDISSR